MPRNPLAQLAQQIEKGLVVLSHWASRLCRCEDVVEVMETLMNSPIQNERFILVAENWSYQKMTQFVAHKMGKKAPKSIAY